MTLPIPREEFVLHVGHLAYQAIQRYQQGEPSNEVCFELCRTGSGPTQRFDGTLCLNLLVGILQEEHNRGRGWIPECECIRLLGERLTTVVEKVQNAAH